MLREDKLNRCIPDSYFVVCARKTKFKVVVSKTMVPLKIKCFPNWSQTLSHFTPVSDVFSSSFKRYNEISKWYILHNMINNFILMEDTQHVVLISRHIRNLNKLTIFSIWKWFTVKILWQTCAYCSVVWRHEDVPFAAFTGRLAKLVYNTHRQSRTIHRPTRFRKIYDMTPS